MARAFDGATQYGVSTATIAGLSGTGDATIACLAKPSGNTGVNMVFVTGSAAGFFTIQLRQNGTAWEAYVLINNAPFVAGAIDTGGLTSGAYQHIAAIWDSAAMSIAIARGGSVRATTNAGSARQPVVTTRHELAMDSVDFGGAPSLFFPGSIAEMGAWDVVLTDNDLTALNNGASPLLVRRPNLQAYWPLLAYASPEIDVVLGSNYTLTGVPTADAHPRIYYFAPPFQNKTTTAVVATTKFRRTLSHYGTRVGSRQVIGR